MGNFILYGILIVVLILIVFSDSIVSDKNKQPQNPSYKDDTRDVNFDDVLKGQWGAYVVGDDLKLVARDEYFTPLVGNVYLYNQSQGPSIAIVNKSPDMVQIYRLRKDYGSWTRQNPLPNPSPEDALKGKWAAGVVDDQLKLPTGEFFTRSSNGTYVNGNAFWYNEGGPGDKLAVVFNYSSEQVVKFFTLKQLDAVWSR